MARPKKADTESNVEPLKRNSLTPEQIVELASRMAQIDAQRKTLNAEATDIRQAVKDGGEDTDAFRDNYLFFKKKRHERDGYEESSKKIWEALNNADTAEMFSFQDDKE